MLVAALAPALGWTALVARLGRVRPALVVALFLWGAVIAACAARTISDQGIVTPVIGGPVLEEIAKAAGLAVLAWMGSDVLRDVRSGIACGAIVGVGFAMTENLEYLLLAALQGGPAGLLRSIYLRTILGGLSHAVFTATTGAGLAWDGPGVARPARVLGLAAAILQHVAWNAVASEAVAAVLCNPVEAGGPCRAAPSLFGLFVVVPGATALVLGPGLVTLLALGRRRGREGSALAGEPSAT